MINHAVDIPHVKLIPVVVYANISSLVSCVFCPACLLPACRTALAELQRARLAPGFEL
jgi:hypothetical protein